jgi:phage shock protein E
MIGLLLTAPGCSRTGGPEPSPAEQTEPAPSAAPSVQEQAWRWIADGALLVDVRTPAEFEQGHLTKARNIPYDQLRERVAELGADREVPVVLYCRTGRRSELARQTLRELGFTHVLNGGGYEALRQARP